MCQFDAKLPAFAIMEVFLNNLPKNLTGQSLKAQLVSFTKALGIRDWSCEKPRRKSFGFIAFLHAQEGELFLHQYERHKYRGSYARASLVILGFEIFCQRSKRPVNRYLLESMTKSAEDRRHAKPCVSYSHVLICFPAYANSLRNSRRSQDEKVVFESRSLSCGYYDYANGKLFYCPEIEWERIRGVAKFAKRILIIEFETPKGKLRIEIPYRIVEAMVISRQRLSFTLTLWEAPRFFRVKSPDIDEMMATLSFQHNSSTSRFRLSGALDSTHDHRQVLEYSLVYQVCVLPDEFEKMMRKLRERNVLPIYHYDVSTAPLDERRSLADGLKEFRSSIQKYIEIIPFGILYQAEALVTNSYLLPWVVQDLLEKIAHLAKEMGANSSSEVGYSLSFDLSK